jgi:hypothetical protein
MLSRNTENKESDFGPITRREGRKGGNWPPDGGHVQVAATPGLAQATAGRLN